MKFHANGPSIPDVLLQRRDAGRVVFLCGAGVSVPSGMPDFVELTRYVVEFFGPPVDSEIMVKFQPWLVDRSQANVPLDQIFNLLHLEYGKDEVNALVTERLSVPTYGNNVGHEHGLIKRISSSQGGGPQIVTTNFDRLFELGERESLDLHVPPAFPDLTFRSKITGVTYLHGRVVEVGSESHSYVLSSADFGRAYLAEGWATRFIRHLLQRYTVVLLGYQAEDPPIKYLLQGLNHDGQFDRSRLYAFEKGLPEEIEAKWRDRGVTAITYSDHQDLWTSMEAWADLADDPRKWRATTIAKTQKDPKHLTPHERGQVAHLLRSVQGARWFSEVNPAPHPEWVCVMDSNVRQGERSSSYDGDGDTFDPMAAYGLDDDQVDISDEDRKQGIGNVNLLVRCVGDDSPDDCHRLAGRPFGGAEAIPVRLGHLITWFNKSIDSPVLAWWIIRQNGLHPRLAQQLAWQVERSGSLNERTRRIWTLILEVQGASQKRRRTDDWFGLKKRIAAEGWTASVLRDFRRVMAPHLKISPPIGVGRSKPPSVSWDKVRLRDLGEWEVVFRERHFDDFEVPDHVLPKVFQILQEQLAIASGLLGDIETTYFRTPTCYVDREVDGRELVDEAGKIVTWFIQLFDRIAAKWPDLAKAHATTWATTDRFFFRKLKLYAFNKVDAFEADKIAKEIMSLDQETFWDTHVVRELLFLLADRWREFSQEIRDQLFDRILTGRQQLSHSTDEEFRELSNKRAACYARFLELQGCELSENHHERLGEMIRCIHGWNDGWATSIVTQLGSRGGWIRTDDQPDSVLSLPVSEVVPKAKEELQRDITSLTDKRPFTGLVKINPRKALAALKIAGRSNDYPEVFWSALFNELPENISPRIKRVFLSRAARLPNAAIVELRYTLGRWLEQNLASTLEFDEHLGWAVYDRVVDGILSGEAAATRSGIGEVRRGRTVIERSRRTIDHAINGPIGQCALALFKVVPGEEQKAGSLVPNQIKSRFERLLEAPGEGSDHAVSVACRQLNWLMFIDPDWTKKCLIPRLAFEHPAAEPAWNGFLAGGQVPSTLLGEIIKPLLLDLFPKVEEFSWDRHTSENAATWLGFMRVFRPNAPSGLSRDQMRSALRAMSDDTRNRFIFWLGLVGQENKNGWTKHVVPLINEDWPRELRYRTSASVRAWIGLLDDTGDSFPTVYEALKRFLVTIETDDQPFYRFTREASQENPITVQFPETTLDLINRVTPHICAHPPFDLPKVLELIAESAPDLTSDPRYLRLIALVEQS